MNRRVLSSLLLIVVGVVIARPAHAITLQPTGAAGKDILAYEFLPTIPFGSGGLGGLLSAGKTGIAHDTESVVQFTDLSAVAALYTGPQVTSATFRVHSISAAAAHFGVDPDAGHPIIIDLYAVTSAWTAASTSWLSRPTTGVLISSITMTGINQFYDFDVKPLVQQWLNSPATNFGLLLRQRAVVGTDPNFYVSVFDSSTAAIGTNAPSLTVVPEPTTLMLALVAAPFVAWRCRRRLATGRQA